MSGSEKEGPGDWLRIAKKKGPDQLSEPAPTSLLCELSIPQGERPLYLQTFLLQDKEYSSSLDPLQSQSS